MCLCGGGEALTHVIMPEILTTFYFASIFLKSFDNLFTYSNWSGLQNAFSRRRKGGRAGLHPLRGVSFFASRQCLQWDKTLVPVSNPGEKFYYKKKRHSLGRGICLRCSKFHMDSKTCFGKTNTFGINT